MSIAFVGKGNLCCTQTTLCINLVFFESNSLNWITDAIQILCKLVLHRTTDELQRLVVLYFSFGTLLSAISSFLLSLLNLRLSAWQINLTAICVELFVLFSGRFSEQLMVIALSWLSLFTLLHSWIYRKFTLYSFILLSWEFVKYAPVHIILCLFPFTLLCFLSGASLVHRHIAKFGNGKNTKNISTHFSCLLLALPPRLQK